MPWASPSLRTNKCITSNLVTGDGWDRLCMHGKHHLHFLFLCSYLSQRNLKCWFPSKSCNIKENFSLKRRWILELFVMNQLGDTFKFEFPSSLSLCAFILIRFRPHFPLQVGPSFSLVHYTVLRLDVKLGNFKSKVDYLTTTVSPSQYSTHFQK